MRFSNATRKILYKELLTIDCVRTVDCTRLFNDKSDLQFQGCRNFRVGLGLSYS